MRRTELLQKFKEGAIFLQEVSFYSTKFFQYASFHAATFDDKSETLFLETEFKGEVDFSYSLLKGYVVFEGKFGKPVFVGKDAFLNFQNARLENTERVRFKNVRLRPNWFVNMDSRKLIFHDVDWENANGNFKTTREGLQLLQRREITGRPHRLLAITCRQLAVNTEENNHFEQASNFRRMAMELSLLGKKLISIWLCR